MTKKEYFGVLRELVLDNAELVAFIDREIELLNKKSASGSQTKTQKENETIKEIILKEMANFESAMTISDMQAQSGVLATYSNQKISALLKQLVESGAVVKTIEKKTDRDKYRHINNPKLNEHGDK